MNKTITPEKLTKQDVNSVDDFYRYVEEIGLLRTPDHARRWTVGTLQILGVNLSGALKKQLFKALPEELGSHLKGIFWPVFFRNTNIPLEEFSTRVARRSRATSDPDFAVYPIKAVFGGLKALISQELSDKIRDDLAPEISKIWDSA